MENKITPFNVIVLLVASIAITLYVSEKMHQNNVQPIDVVQRTHDPVVVAIGRECQKNDLTSVYRAFVDASQKRFTSTAEYAQFVHDQTNSYRKIAWDRLSKDLETKFSETSDAKLSEDRIQAMQNYFSDVASGVKLGSGIK